MTFDTNPFFLTSFDNDAFFTGKYKSPVKFSQVWVVSKKNLKSLDERKTKEARMKKGNAFSIGMLWVFMSLSCGPDDVMSESELKKQISVTEDGLEKNSCNTKIGGHSDSNRASSIPTQDIIDRKPILLSGKQGEWKYFVFHPPRHRKEAYPKARLFGGSGDPDLYISHQYYPVANQHAFPNRNCYFYKSDRPGTDEYCPAMAGLEGHVIIGVYAYKDYKDVNLAVDYEITKPVPEPEPCMQELQDDQPILISSRKRKWQYFYIDVPVNSTLTGILDGGFGDPDIYIKAGSKPTGGSYDCKSDSSGSHELCSIDFVSGRIYIGVYASRRFKEVTLHTQYEQTGQEILAYQSEIKNLSAKKGEWKYFYITGAGVYDGTIPMWPRITAGSGDPSIYLWPRDYNPKSDCYICKTDQPGSSDSCQEQIHICSNMDYIGLYANTDYSNVEFDLVVLNASPLPDDFQPFPPLINGEPVVKKNFIRHPCVYLNAKVPDNSTVQVVFYGGKGDPDLYLSHEHSPGPGSYDCKSENPGSEESCTIENASGNVSICVYNYMNFSNVTIEARW